jgi:ABC-2 type transport system permease protein
MTARRPARRGGWRIFVREWRRIFFNPLLLVMTIVMPLVLSGLLIAIFSTSIATDLPVGVIDLDASDLSRTTVRLLDATPDIAVTERFDNLGAGRSAIIAGRIYGLLMLPKNLERDVKAGRRPDVVFFYNTQMLTTGNLVLKGASAALASVEAGVRLATRLASGQSASEAQAALQPVPVDVRPLFNPTMNYAYFLLAALVPSVLQVIVTTVSAYAIAMDVTPRRLRKLKRLCASPVRFLVAKTLPYTLIYCTASAIADAVLIGPLDMPVNGALPVLALAALLFVLACQLFGTWLGLMLQPVASAVSIATLVTAPAFGFMGVGFPRLGMNAFAQGWGALLPGKWYLEARIDQTVRGTPIDLGALPIAVLAGFVVVLFAASVLWLLPVWFQRSAPPALAREGA